jgi:hypothetical protein
VWKISERIIKYNWLTGKNAAKCIGKLVLNVQSRLVAVSSICTKCTLGANKTVLCLLHYRELRHDSSDTYVAYFEQNVGVLTN